MGSGRGSDTENDDFNSFQGTGLFLDGARVERYILPSRSFTAPPAPMTMSL